MRGDAAARPTPPATDAVPGALADLPTQPRRPRRARAWVPPLLALAGALALWPLLKYQLGPDNVLVIQLRSAQPLRGGELELVRPGRAPQRRELRAEELPPSARQQVDLELIPLGEHHPAGQGTEVWLVGISSACGEDFDVRRMVTGPGWRPGYRNYPAVWTGGERGVLRYSAQLCGPVQVRLVHHPHSGRVLIRARGANGAVSERTVDLYRAESASGAADESIAVPVAQPELQLRLQLPRRTEQLELSLLGPRSAEVQGVRWVSPRSAPLWGEAGPQQRFEATDDGERLRIRVPQLSPGFWTPDLLDVLSVLGVALLLWWALEAWLGGGRVSRLARRHGRWGRYALVPALSWGLLWATLYPGVVSNDPIFQWKEVLSGDFVNWHPPIHTWWLWLVGGPFDSLGPVAGVQVLLFAALWGVLVHELEQWGAPAWVRWGMVAWAALAPAFGLHVVSVWKDAPFGLAVLYCSVLLLRAERRGGLGTGEALRLGAALAAVSLLRHNGPLVALPVLAVAVWRYGGRRPRLALVGMCLGLVVLVRGPLYALADVEPTPTAMRQALLVHRIGLLAQRTPQLPPEDQQLLEQVAPLSAWRERYTCVTVGPLLFDSPLRVERMEGHADRFAALLGRFAREAPGALLEHSACVTRYLWAPLSPLYIGPFDTRGGFVDPNPHGWAARSWLPKLQAHAWPFIQRTYGEQGWVRTLVWQPASSLYLVVLALLVACWRMRSLLPAFVLLSVLCNTLALLLISPNPDLRFQWPLLLHTPLALALALLPSRPRGPPRAGASGGLAEQRAAGCANG